MHRIHLSIYYSVLVVYMKSYMPYNVACISYTDYSMFVAVCVHVELEI